MAPLLYWISSSASAKGAPVALCEGLQIIKINVIRQKANSLS